MTSYNGQSTNISVSSVMALIRNLDWMFNNGSSDASIADYILAWFKAKYARDRATVGEFMESTYDVPSGREAKVELSGKTSKLDGEGPP